MTAIATTTMPKRKKVMNRQDELLLLVDSRCAQAQPANVHEVVGRYYVPMVTDIEFPSGAGDAAAFRALERKGLIYHPPRSPRRYAFIITEDGRLRAQTLEPLS